MLHTRLDLITADPLVLGGCIKYIEGEVRPAVESLPGSLGLSLLASPELGAAVLESFWRRSMRWRRASSRQCLSAGNGPAGQGIGDCRAVPDSRL